MVNLVEGPEMVQKRHCNQIKSRHINEENNTPDEVEPMEVLFDIFNEPVPQKAPEIEVRKKCSKRKGRDTERNKICPKRKKYGLYRVNPKKEGVISYL